MMIFWIFFVGALDFGKLYWDFFVVLLVGFMDLSPSNVVGGSKQQLAHQDQDFSWCQPNELFWPGSWWVPRSQQRQLWMFHVTVDPPLSSFLLEKTLRFRRVMITFPAKYKLRSVNFVLHEPPKGWQLRWSLEHIGIVLNSFEECEKNNNHSYFKYMQPNPRHKPGNHDFCAEWPQAPSLKLFSFVGLTPTHCRSCWLRVGWVAIQNCFWPCSRCRIWKVSWQRSQSGNLRVRVLCLLKIQLFHAVSMLWVFCWLCCSEIILCPNNMTCS